MRLRERAEKYAGVKFEGLNPLGEPTYSSESYGALMSREVKMAAYIAGAREMVELAAQKAFDKIRCDDRTDRWQVANEVAAHIRALAEGGE